MTRRGGQSQSVLLALFNRRRIGGHLAVTAEDVSLMRTRFSGARTALEICMDVYQGHTHPSQAVTPFGLGGDFRL